MFIFYLFFFVAKFLRPIIFFQCFFLEKNGILFKKKMNYFILFWVYFYSILVNGDSKFDSNKDRLVFCEKFLSQIFVKSL